VDISLWLIIAFSLTWFMSYSRASLSSFTLIFIVLMAAGTFFNVIGFVSWLLFAIIAIPLNIDNIRQQFISLPMLLIFKKIMPQMSETEQQAIDAGTTWFDAELFRGNPNWTTLHNYPQPRLSAQEKAFLEGPVEELCAMTDDWHTTHEIADLSPADRSYILDDIP